MQVFWASQGLCRYGGHPMFYDAWRVKLLAGCVAGVKATAMVLLKAQVMSTRVFQRCVPELRAHLRGDGLPAVVLLDGPQSGRESDEVSELMVDYEGGPCRERRAAERALRLGPLQLRHAVEAAVVACPCTPTPSSELWLLHFQRALDTHMLYTDCIAALQHSCIEPLTIC